MCWTQRTRKTPAPYWSLARYLLINNPLIWVDDCNFKFPVGRTYLARRWHVQTRMTSCRRRWRIGPLVCGTGTRRGLGPIPSLKLTLLLSHWLDTVQSPCCCCRRPSERPSTAALQDGRTNNRSASANLQPGSGCRTRGQSEKSFDGVIYWEAGADN